jgi:hypothetical protein
MNILDKIIVDKEESHSQKNHSCFSIRSLCLFSQKDYENLKIVPLELLLNISVVLKGRDKL